LLETTDASIDEIAATCGFGSATLFRHHFSREVGVAPSAYRRSFARDDAGSRSDATGGDRDSERVGMRVAAIA
jgi:AraC-like DNA-binding protein